MRQKMLAQIFARSTDVIYGNCVILKIHIWDTKQEQPLFSELLFQRRILQATVS